MSVCLTVCLSFFPALKTHKSPLLCHSKSFWLLLQLGGCGIGIFSALLTLLEQSLCVKGYSASFSGGCGAAAIGAGLVVSVAIGGLVDKKAKLKAKLEDIIKVSDNYHKKT